MRIDPEKMERYVEIRTTPGQWPEVVLKIDHWEFDLTQGHVSYDNAVELRRELGRALARLVQKHMDGQAMRIVSRDQSW